MTLNDHFFRVSTIPKPHLSWLSRRRSEFGCRLPHLHLHHTQAHLQPCLQQLIPGRIQHLPSRKVTVHHRAVWSFFVFCFFPPDSSLPVARCFECWRSKLRKTELHLTRTQEAKNKQNHDTLLLLLSRFSRVQLCATPEMAAHQAPPSLGFSRQQHWSGLPFPPPMHESEKWKWRCSVVSDS